MAAARTLLRLGDADRHLWLYDTFAGMTEPGAEDVSLLNESAREQYRTFERWCYASLEEVRAAVLSTGYDPAKVHFIVGKVEETLPGRMPDQISLLRLDTDWYQSTLHELEHLYPRLAQGGVLLLDDYGHWQGSRQATDEYLQREGSRSSCTGSTMGQGSRSSRSRGLATGNVCDTLQQPWQPIRTIPTPQRRAPS